MRDGWPAPAARGSVPGPALTCTPACMRSTRTLPGSPRLWFSSASSGTVPVVSPRKYSPKSSDRAQPASTAESRIPSFTVTAEAPTPAAAASASPPSAAASAAAAAAAASTSMSCPSLTSPVRMLSSAALSASIPTSGLLVPYTPLATFAASSPEAVGPLTPSSSGQSPPAPSSVTMPGCLSRLGRRLAAVEYPGSHQSALAGGFLRTGGCFHSTMLSPVML
mmetsp:Transcript_15294/g.57812  ORF Transcript_15294/g.57812 Transcript_15294/m.57812 type:complete len:222 (-) Transcript_15294:868-1533(-)